MTNEMASGVSGQTPPTVIKWFKVYTGFMIGLYLLCLLAGPAVIFAFTKAAGDEKAGLMVQGVMLMIIGLPLAVAFALPFFLARKRWVWAYNLVLICIGMTSCCILPRRFRC